MKKSFILENIAVSFELEISNEFEVKDNEIIISLADGTKAKITTKYVA